MSNITCEKCGAIQKDAGRHNGYVSGCQHYPPEKSMSVEMDFGDGEWKIGVFDGSFAYTRNGLESGKCVHPVLWRQV